MVSDTYLDPEVVKNDCRRYITFLSRENIIYRDILQKFRRITETENYRGATIDALKFEIGKCILAIENLMKANASDIDDAKKLINMVGEEVFDGNEILRGKIKALEDINYYGKMVSECFNKEYQEIEKGMIEYWRIQRANYEKLLSEAQEVYYFYQKKEGRYDQINYATKTLFINSSDIRRSAVPELPIDKKNSKDIKNFASEISASYTDMNAIGKKLLEDSDIGNEEIFEYNADSKLEVKTSENDEIRNNFINSLINGSKIFASELSMMMNVDETYKYTINEIRKMTNYMEDNYGIYLDTLKETQETNNIKLYKDSLQDCILHADECLSSGRTVVYEYKRIN